MNVGDDPASDTKVQVLIVLALALTSMAICFYGAFSLQRASVSVVDYIKGTTASRTNLWFWQCLDPYLQLHPSSASEGNHFVPPIGTPPVPYLVGVLCATSASHFLGTERPLPRNMHSGILQFLPRNSPPDIPKS